MSKQTPQPVDSGKTDLKWHDALWLMAYSVRALVHLVHARLVFAKLRAADISGRNRKARAIARARGDGPIAERTLKRIAFVIPRVASRLPWRSDCTIQAIAAQNWLASIGATSEICIGVDRPDAKQFLAHAWLIHEGQVITGGAINKFRPLLGDSQS